MQSVFFWLRPVGRRDLSAGQEQKQNTTQGVFLPTGLSFPCLSPGPEQKKHTLGGGFFALAPPKGRGAQRGATKKEKHVAHPETTAKKNLETNDTGHEQKGATKKKTPWPCKGAGRGLACIARFNDFKVQFQGLITRLGFRELQGSGHSGRRLEVMLPALGPYITSALEP